jgi:hypothetical protein
MNVTQIRCFLALRAEGEFHARGETLRRGAAVADRCHPALAHLLGGEMGWHNGWSFAAMFDGEFSNITRSYAGKGTARYVW